MFQTILTALDGSDHSEKAIHLAADIAAKYDAELVFLHVTPDGPLPERLKQLAEVEFHDRDKHAPVGHLSHSGYADPAIIGESIDHDMQRASQIYRHLADQIMTSARSIAYEHGVSKVDAVVEIGDPSERILQQAKNRKANLIVMGNRGLSDLEGLLQGSVSHKVSHLAPCTCVTVR